MIKFCDITKKNVNVVYLGVNPYSFYDTLSVRTKINNLISKEYILSIHRELGEVLDTIPWKLHRKNEVVKSKANIA